MLTNSAEFKAQSRILKLAIEKWVTTLSKIMAAEVK